MTPSSIKFFSRVTGNLEEEKVYGDASVRFLYESKIGGAISGLLPSKLISQIYGLSQSTTISGHKVPAFVKKFDIDLGEYQAGSLKGKSIEDSYASFNEFFIRKFNDGERSFSDDESTFGAPCEARYFGYNAITDDLSIPVKGNFLKATDLLENDEWGKAFRGGPLFIARLCPVDYHRYHYPLKGKTIDSYSIHGDYDSVNPIALKKKEDIFIKNERRVSILDCGDWGRLAYIEVGAICVGKIVQSHNETHAFHKGSEKGYFLFGGSTVIALGEPGKWGLSSDIIENTKNGIETYIQLGDSIATRS